LSAADFAAAASAAALAATHAASHVTGAGVGVGTTTGTDGAAAIVIEITTSLCTPFESVALTVNVYVPAVVGVPEIWPVAGSSDRPAGNVPFETVYANAPTPPAAAVLNAYAVPAVPLGIGEGAEKSISGLITRVGLEISVRGLPTPLVAVASTTMYLPSSELVGTYVADVAPEISVQELRSAGSVQTFH
jgi:hypothetical protein